MSAAAELDAVEAQLLAAGQAVRKICFHGLTLDIAIGVHDFERGRTQPVRLDLTLYLADPAPPASDTLAAVFDYDQVRDGALALARSGHFNLQETLVERIAALCLDSPAVAVVRVASQKTGVYADVDGVGYEVVRFRAG